MDTLPGDLPRIHVRQLAAPCVAVGCHIPSWSSYAPNPWLSSCSYQGVFFTVNNNYNCKCMCMSISLTILIFNYIIILMEMAVKKISYEFRLTLNTSWRKYNRGYRLPGWMPLVKDLQIRDIKGPALKWPLEDGMKVLGVEIHNYETKSMILLIFLKLL